MGQQSIPLISRLLSRIDKSWIPEPAVAAVAVAVSAAAAAAAAALILEQQQQQQQHLVIPFPTLAPTVDHVVHTVVNDEGTMGARQLAWGGVKRHPGNVVPKECTSAGMVGYFR